MTKKTATPIDYDTEIEESIIDDIIGNDIASAPTDEEILERALKPGKKTALIHQITKAPKEERKTCRLPLLLKPSLYNKLKDVSDDTGISMNEIVTRIIIDAFKEN